MMEDCHLNLIIFNSLLLRVNNVFYPGASLMNSYSNTNVEYFNDYNVG